METSRLENTIEIKFRDDNKGEICKILLIFSDKQRAKKEEKQIKNNINGTKDFYQYLKEANYKVNLEREDLEIMVEAAENIPPFYKMAWENNTDRVIIFN